jgi:hypothetical protein
MKKISKQRVMAILIGAIMLASIAEVALLRNNQQQDNQPQQLPGAVNRKLSLDETRSVLTSGRILIEYFYNESCTSCAAKEGMYREFVNSDAFVGFAVLSYGVSENETADWLIDLALNQVSLKDVNTTADMQKLFCDNSIVSEKPNICILEGI